ncbi:hypothetical protein V8C86DRAFT_2993153, partial [Haematococcus lacustris]
MQRSSPWLLGTGSPVLQGMLAAVLGEDDARSRAFFNRLFNTCSYTLTEFTATGAPLWLTVPPPPPARRAGSSAALQAHQALMDEHQSMRRALLMFDLVVRLLRLLEFAVLRAGNAFGLGSMNLARLLELVPYVLGHFTCGPDARKLDAFLGQARQVSNTAASVAVVLSAATMVGPQGERTDPMHLAGLDLTRPSCMAAKVGAGAGGPLARRRSGPWGAAPWCP